METIQGVCAETGGTIIDDSEGEEERKHQLLTEDLSRAHVSIVEGLFEPMHEYLMW